MYAPLKMTRKHHQKVDTLDGLGAVNRNDLLTIWHKVTHAITKLSHHHTGIDNSSSTIYKLTTYTLVQL